MIYYGNETAYNSLYHYGVKGMKWGVRKQRESVGLRSRLTSARAGFRENLAWDYKHPKWKGDAEAKEIADYNTKRAKELRAQAKKEADAHKSRVDKMKTYIKDHKKQIAIGAAVVGGLAIAGIALNERRVKNRYIDGYNRVATGDNYQKMFEYGYSNGRRDSGGYVMPKIHSRKNMTQYGYVKGSSSNGARYFNGAGYGYELYPSLNAKDRFRSSSSIRAKGYDSADRNREFLKRAAIDEYNKIKRWM